RPSPALAAALDRSGLPHRRVGETDASAVERSSDSQVLRFGCRSPQNLDRRRVAVVDAVPALQLVRWIADERLPLAPQPAVAVPGSPLPRPPPYVCAGGGVAGASRLV